MPTTRLPTLLEHARSRPYNLHLQGTLCSSGRWRLQMVLPEQLLEQAVALAVKCHAGQSRKHTVRGRRLPYIVHPVMVMRTVWGWGAGDPALLSAAVLHDVLEDSQVTYKQLAKDFGEEVAGIVKEVTHDRKADGDKAEYLRRFATASVPALVVKLADRYCNPTDCVLTDPGRVAAYLGKSAPCGDYAAATPRDFAAARAGSGYGNRIGVRQPVRSGFVAGVPAVGC